MRGYRATRAGSSGRLFCALAVVASLGLAGCSDVDNALFGDDKLFAMKSLGLVLPSAASSPTISDSLIV